MTNDTSRAAFEAAVRAQAKKAKTLYRHHSDTIVDQKAPPFPAEVHALGRAVTKAIDDLADLALSQLQQQAEPVAWGMPDALGNIVDCISELDRQEDVTKWSEQYPIPLYASPSPREVALEKALEPTSNVSFDDLAEELENLYGRLGVMELKEAARTLRRIAAARAALGETQE